MGGEMDMMTEKVVLRLGQVWRTADGNEAVMLVCLCGDGVEGVGLFANRIASKIYHSHDQLQFVFPVLVFDPSPQDKAPTSALRLRRAAVGSKTVDILRDAAGAKGRLTVADWKEMVGRRIIDIVETSAAHPADS